MKYTKSSRRKRWFFARSMARAYREWLEKRTRSRNKVAKRAAARPLFAEALEPRVLFSASPAPVEDVPVVENEEAIAHTSVELSSSSKGGEDLSPDSSGGIDFTDADLDQLAAEAAKSTFGEYSEGVASDGSSDQDESNNEATDSSGATLSAVVEADVAISVDDAAVQALWNEGIRRWEASGISAEQLAVLESATLEVTDLAGSHLGSASGTNVVLDDDGGGNGWFVDATPETDEEFDSLLQSPEGFDLLTVIMHEQGHVLGVSHVPNGSDDLMFGFLGEGERRLPASNQAEGAIPGSIEDHAFMSLGWVQLGGDIDGEAGNDNSGTSVATSADGTRVIIGANLNDGNGSDSGHARIYEYDGTSWNQLGGDIDGEAADDESGVSVAMSADGSRVIIGAMLNGSNNGGHARVYEYNGTSWNQLGADIDGEVGFDRSGSSVAMSADGSRVIIGANENNGNGSNSGHARIYEYDGTSWNQLGGDIDGEAGDDQAGTSVAMSADGSRVIIGAPRNDGNGSNSGHARIYEYNGGSWNQLGGDIDGEAANDRFGTSVAISDDGSRVIIGAILNGDNGRSSGHARIYEYDGTSWNQLGGDIDGEAGDDRAGTSVEMSADGSRVIIGAPRNDGNGINSGHARIYEYDGTSWNQLGADLNAPGLDSNSGASVAMSDDGTRVIFSAPGRDQSRIYELRLLFPEITVEHDANGAPIDSGDVSPSVISSEGTDFGSIDTATGLESRTFRIRNDGTGTLTLTGQPSLATGSHFEISSLSGTGLTLAVGEVRTFTVTFDTVAAGVHTDTVIIGNDDSDEATYTFQITGEGFIGVPEISVEHDDNGVPIVSGDVSPSDISSEGTDFGAVDTATGSETRTFRIRNDGTTTLILSGPPSLVTGSHFAISSLSGTGLTLAVGEVRTFTVTFDASSVGVHTDTVTIGNNDPDETSYTFQIAGEGFIGVPEISVENDGNGVPVASGDVSPSDISSEGTDFGSIGTLNASEIRTFRIRNDGTTTLILTGPPSLATGSDFAISALSGTGLTLAVGEVRTFTVTFDPTAIGVHTDTVTIGSDDSDEAIYTFQITGEGIIDWSPLGGDIDGEAVGDQSGRSVATSADGTRVIIGANLNDGNGTSSGHARIYEYDGTNWNQLGADIDGVRQGDQSGQSVSMSADGTRVIIGANINDDGPGNVAGHARIYEYDGASWNQLGADILGEAGGDQSGHSVAMSADGSRVIIGAPFNDGNGSNSGHARIYEYDGTSWNQLGGDIDGERGSDRFGSSVAMSDNGNRVVIGAIANRANRGHARIYEFDGTSWNRLGGDIDGEAGSDQSGHSVAMSADGSRVIIGAPFNDGNGSNSGHARIYEYDGTSWNQLGGDIDGEGSNDQFGNSVAMNADGSRVIIGAIENNGNGSNSGHARIYEYDGTSWNQLGGDIDGEASGDQSGRSVAMSDDGTRVIIGATFNDGNGGNSGHVRIYDLPSVPEITVEHDTNGVPIASGDVSPSDISSEGTDFGSIDTATGSEIRTFRIRNDGNAPLTLTGQPSLTTGSHFAISSLSGTGLILAEGEVRTFTVTFDPTADGVNTDTVTIGSDDADEAAYTFLITGESTSPEITILHQATSTEIVDGDTSPSDASSEGTDFGQADTASGSVVRTFVVRNDGTADLTLSGQPSLSGDTGGHFTVSTLSGGGLVLTTGETRTFTVTFDPTAAGTHTATVNLGNDDADEAAYDFLITGEGTIPEITILHQVTGTEIVDGDTSPSDVSSEGTDFGQVDIAVSSVVRSFVVRNDGTADLTLSGQPSLSGDSGGHFAVSTLSGGGLVLATGETRTFTVTFDPTAAGTHTATVNFGSDDADEGSYDFLITGEGFVGVPEITVEHDDNGVSIASGDVSPSDISSEGTDFGSIDILTASETRTFRIRNDGFADLTLTGQPSLATGSEFAISALSGTGLTLGAGEVRTFTVTFDPTAIGVHTDTVTIGSDDSDEAAYIFQITGEGIVDWSQLGGDLDGEAASDRLGTSVAVSDDGTRVIVGATRNDANGSDSGHARIYEYDGTSWNQLGADIDGEGAGDRLGQSVAISADGSRVIIGGFLNDGNGADSGHARIYEYDGTNWNQLGADIDGEAAGDRAGTSVAMSDDGSRVIIGSVFNDDNGADSGSARIYEYDGTSWSQLGGDIDGEAAGDRTGTSVAMSADGSRVIIGATFNDDGPGNDSGHARIYEYDGISWNQLGTDIDGEAAGDRFGQSVAMSSDGSRVIIGAIFNDDGPGNDSGHARIYEYDGTNWNQLGGDIDGEAGGDRSGQSVSMSADGSRVIIGAIFNDDGPGNDSGHARIYEYDGTSWNQLGRDIDGERGSDRFGSSVGMSGDGSRVIIGAIFNDDGPGNDSGHVRIYELPAPTYDFSAATYSVAEGDATNSTLVVTVNRSVLTTGTSSVDVVLGAGVTNPATSGTDYTAGPITVDFAAGETSKTVSIELLGDTTVELDETIALSFANFTDGGVAGATQATSELTITNDDIAPLKPTYDFSAATYSAAEGDVTNSIVEVTVNRSVGTTGTSSVDVVLGAGATNPATSGVDYTAGPITVSFAAGETSKTVSIELLGDTTIELDETIALSFTNFTDDGEVGTTQATAELTITNDDVATTEVVVDAGGNLMITDVDGADTNDDITIVVDGTDFHITDATNSIDERIAIASVSGDIVIEGTGGDDTLTIDLSDGAITQNIVFHGGAGGSDNLIIKGTGSEVVEYTPDSDDLGNGSISIDGSTIQFTGLEPVEAINVASFTLNIDGGGNDVTLSDTGNDFTAINITNAANVFIDDTDGINLGNIDVTGDLTIEAGGAVDVVGTISIGGDANIDTNANGGSGGTITNSAGSISVTGSTTLDAGDQDISLDNATNDFGGQVNATGNDVVIDDENGVTLGDINASGGVDVDAGGDVSIEGTVTTTGALDIDTDANGGTGGTIDDSTGGDVNVGGETTLDAGDQNVALDNATNDFTGQVNATGNDVAIDDENGVTLGDINAGGDVEVDAGGDVSIEGTVTTPGALDIDTNANGGTGGTIDDSTGGDVNVGGETTLDAGDQNVALDNATNDFTGQVNATGNDVAIDDENGVTLGDINAGGDVEVDAGGDVSIEGAVTTTGGLAIDTNANGGTGGTIDDSTGGDVNVGGETTLDAGDQNVTLDNATNDFTGQVNATGNDVAIDDENGVTLGDINAGGDVDVDAGGDVSLAGDVTSGGNLAIDTNTNGGSGGTIDDGAGGTVNVTGNSDLDAGDQDIELTNPTNDFGGAVTVVADDATIDDVNGITFDDVTTTGDLSADAGGDIDFSGTTAVGGTQDLEPNKVVFTEISLSNGVLRIVDVAGEDNQLTITVDTGVNPNELVITDANGTSVFDCAVSGATGAGTTALRLPLTGITDIIFDSGAGNDSVTINGPLTLSGNLDIDAETIQLDSSNITTGGDQTYNGAVTLGEDVTLQGSDVSFGSTVNSASGETNQLSVQGDVSFGGEVGGTDAVGELDVSGETEISGGGVTTTGDQSYTGGVTIASETTLDAGLNGNILMESSDNDLGGTLNITNANDVSIDSAGDLTLGTVSTAGDLNLDTGGDVEFSGSSDIGGNLNADTDANGGTGGSISDGLGGDLNVGGTTTLDAGDQDVALDNTGNDFGGQVDVTGGNVSIDDENGINLGDINATGGVEVDAAGDVTVGGSISAGSLEIDTNANGGTGGAINDGAAGEIEVTGTTTLDAGDQDITLDNSTNDFGGQLDITGDNINVDDQNGVTLGDVNATGNVGVDAAGDVTIEGDVNAGSLDIDTDANGGSGGTIDDGGSGSVSVTGETTLDAGNQDITLDNSTNDFGDAVNASGDDLTLEDSGDLTLGDITTSGDVSVATGGDVDFSDNAEIGGNLEIDTTANGSSTGGIISDSSGSLEVGGTSDLDAGDQDIGLTNPLNDFGGAVSIEANEATIDDVNDLILGDVSTTEDLNVDSGGTVTEGGTTTVGGTSDIDENVVIGTDVSTFNGATRITDVAGATNNGFRVSLDGGNIKVEDTAAGTTENINPTDASESLALYGTGGDDTLTIDLSNGVIPTDIVFYGGDGGNDTLIIIGTGGEVVEYTPDSDDFGNGKISIDGSTIQFTGLEPVEAINVASFTLDLPGEDDVVDIANGVIVDDVTHGGQDALILTGTSGGTVFELARVRNATDVIIDTTIPGLSGTGTDGDDTITVTSASNSHGITNLTINTGSGTDSVSVNGAIALGTNGTLDIDSGRDVTISADITTTGSGAIDINAGRSVLVDSGAVVSVVNGDLTISANFANTTHGGGYRAVEIGGSALLTTGGTGNIDIFGRTTSSSGADREGIRTVNNLGTISSTAVGGGSITLTGFGGGGSGFNDGIQFGGDLSTVDGDIVMAGTAGETGGQGGRGIVFTATSNVAATGAANITISGTGDATSTIIQNDGIETQNGAELIHSSGTITLTGVSSANSPAVQIGSGGLGDSSSTGDIILNGDTVDINGNIQSSGALTIAATTASTTIGLGGGGGTLNLTDSELSRLLNGFSSITIGDATAGDIDIDTATFSDSLNLVTGGEVHDGAGTDINMTTPTDTVTIDGTVAPGILEVGSNFAFADNSSFDVEIGGTSPGAAATDHDQINVTGTVTIGTNVTLNESVVGGFSPTAGDDFVIINNDGTDAVIGTFAGLAEGATVSTDFLGSGLAATISYTGGTGNDVVITVGNAKYDFSAATYSVAEGNATNTTMVVTVNRTESTIGASSVEVALAAGATNGATAGNDFTAGPITVSFADGEASKTVTIELLGDTTVELDETIALTLQNASGSGAIGTTQATAELTITNDDSGPGATTEVVVDVGGNLTITDVNNDDTDDDITIVVSGTDYHIFDVSNSIDQRISIASVTGDIVVESTGGNDTITIGNLGTIVGDLRISGGLGEDVIIQTGDAVLTGGSTVTYTAERVRLEGGADLTTDTGDVTIAGNGGTGNGVGVILKGGSINSTSGNVAITGEGGDSGVYNRGILLDVDSVAGVSTISTGGSITLAGTGGSTGVHATGVTLIGATVESTGSGPVLITGSGGTGLLFSEGVAFHKGTTIDAGTGDLTIMGTGGSTGSMNRGVMGSISDLIADGGNIAISGTGGGTMLFGIGVDLSAVDMTTIGSGSVTITGTGASGTLGNMGVRLAGNGFYGGSVSTEDGAINITGTGNGSTLQNHGVQLLSGFEVEATGTGNVTIAGTSGAGTILNHGVTVVTGADIRVGDGGALEVRGTSLGSVSVNKGVELTSSNLGATGSGTISVWGTGSASASGVLNTGVSISGGGISSASGDILVSGLGGTGTTMNEGVRMVNATVRSTALGAISLIGTANAGTTGVLNTGVYLLSVQLESGGIIGISGTGGGGSLLNHGIYMQNMRILGSTPMTVGRLGTGSMSEDESGNYFL